jgi:hypothetical protein
MSRRRISRLGSVCGAFISTSLLILMFLSFLVAIYAAVDQGLSDRIAKAIGHPSVKPLQVKSAAEVLKFRTNIGLKLQ